MRIDRWVARKPFIGAIVVALVAISSVGCSSAGKLSTAAAPLVVCGTTLDTAPAGATWFDATGATARVNGTTYSNGFFLLLSTSCSHGADLHVLPTDATIDRVAHTHDGRIAVIGLRPVLCHFELIAHRSAGPSTTIKVDIPTGANLAPQARPCR